MAKYNFKIPRIELHCHTMYSSLDGVSSPEEYVKRAKELGIPALAITDHGTISGAMHFYQVCKKNDIIPLIGCELYVAKSKDDTTPDGRGVDHINRHHLIVFAKNDIGFKNLSTLTSEAYLNYDRRPIVYVEDLFKYKEGLICTTACILTLCNDQSWVERFKHEFGDDFYIEINPHNLCDQWDKELKKFVKEDVNIQIAHNQNMIRLAKENDVKLITTLDAHYSRKEDKVIQDIFIKGAAWNKDGWHFSTDDYHLCNANQAWTMFEKYNHDKYFKLDQYEASLWNAWEVVKKCKDLTLERPETLLPFPYESHRFYNDNVADAKSLIMASIQKSPRFSLLKNPEYLKRLKFELDIIEQKGFLDYFLIVDDILHWNRQQGYLTGPGRGCLKWDTPIFLTDGTVKNISDVKEGDTVVTQDGSHNKVVRTWEYDCNEKLLEIKSFHGDTKGVTLTKDHKILAEKVAGPKGFENWSDSTKRSARVVLEPKGDLEWLRADQIEKDDWVFIPCPKPSNENKDNHLDLKDYLSDLDEWDSEFVYEYQKNNSRKQFRKKYKRFIPLDNDFFEILGKFASGGYIVKKENVKQGYRIGFCFNSIEEVEEIKRYKYLGNLYFGIDSKEYKSSKGNQKSIEWGGRIIHTLFSQIFKEYKNTAQTKHVPEVIFNRSEENICSFIKGCLKGDGSFKDQVIHFSTISKILAQQLRYLCWMVKIPASLLEDPHRIGTVNKSKNGGIRNLNVEYKVNIPHHSKIGSHSGFKAKYTFYEIEGGLLTKVRSIKEVENISNKVYDIEVENDHNYLTTSFLVHNSAAGSLLSYILQITHVDPIKYNLLFERFLSLDRDNYPDIDLDFEKQEETFDYLRNKYGEDNFARIGAFQLCKTKTALKDSARVLKGKDSFFEMNNITTKLPNSPPGDSPEKEKKFFLSLTDSEHENYSLELKEYLEENPEIEEAVLKILGKAKTSKDHPCFPGYSKIFTEKGYKTFEELDGRILKILTSKGWKKAKIFENGEKEVFDFKIKPSKTKIFPQTCTIDHSFLTEKGNYTPLIEGEFLSTKCHMDFDNDFIIAGWLWNDGHYHDGNFYLYFTPGKDEEILEYLLEGEYRKGEYDKLVVLSREYSKQILDRVGYSFEKIKNKKPPNSKNWTIKQKLSWLRGVFSANGAIVKNSKRKIRIGLTSKPMIEYISKELESLGFPLAKLIPTKDSLIKSDGKTYLSKGNSRLDLNATCALMFQKLIGFIQKYKQEELNNFKNRVESKPKSLGVQKVYDFSILEGDTLDGLVDNFWAHNCASVISDTPLKEIVPLFLTKPKEKNKWTTAWNGPQCEARGLIKLDILGLNTLRDIAGCIKLIEERHGKKYDIYNMPVDDPKVIKEFAKGNTDTVFQFNTPVSKNLLRRGSIKNFEDCAVTTALIRPGPAMAGMDKTWADRKSGRLPKWQRYNHDGQKESVPYSHPLLDEILKDTYGVMAYQEQIQRAFVELGGFTLVESNQVRKIVAKSKGDKLKELKPKFLEYATTKLQPVWTEQQVNAFFEDVLGFGRYAFNASHSVAYSYVGYLCQYFKTYYPVEWWAAVAINASENDVKIMMKNMKDFFDEIEINRSKERFVLHGDKVQMPLQYLKGMGPGGLVNIVENQPYENFEDFIERTNGRSVRKDTVISLVLAGVFRDVEPGKTEMELLEQYFKIKKKEMPEELVEIRDDKAALRRKKREINPFYKSDWRNEFSHVWSSEVINYEVAKKMRNQEKLKIVGEIDDIRLGKTKKGETFARLTLIDEGKSVNIVIWPDKYKVWKNKIEKGLIVQISGSINKWNGTVSVVLDDLYNPGIA